MEFTFENRMTGERHPVIGIHPSNPNHLILTDSDRDQLNPDFYKNGYRLIANGFSLLVDELQDKEVEFADLKYQWRLYKPGDSMNESVFEPLRGDQIFWDALESIKHTLPQPNIDKERERDELRRGLKSFMLSWNEDNAKTGQAYACVEINNASQKSSSGVRGSYLGSPNTWERGKD